MGDVVNTNSKCVRCGDLTASWKRCNACREVVCEKCSDGHECKSQSVKVDVSKDPYNVTDLGYDPRVDILVGRIWDLIEKRCEERNYGLSYIEILGCLERIKHKIQCEMDE